MRPEKTSIVSEISTRVNGSSFLLLTDYRGLKVEQFSDLRRQLGKADARVQVVKNRMLRVITRERGWTDIDGQFKGQSAIIVGSDVVQAAKVLKRFSNVSGIPAVKAGMLGNMYLTPAQIDALAELPPRETLLGMVVGTVAAPLSRLVGVMKQKVSTLVYVLKAVEEKKQQNAN
jgi:large subunit ribosomal protein L10